MGFFTKRYNRNAKPQNELTPAEQDFKGNTPPITGGNSFETQKILQAQDMINQSTIPRLVKNYQNSLVDKSYNLYWLLQFHANYFTSLFPVKTKDARINELIYNCFRVHFLYGGCGVYKKGDTLIGLYENKVHVNKIGEITKIEFKSLTDMLACKGIDEHKKLDICLTLSGDELKNYARLRTQSIGFGAIVTWLPFIKQQESILKKIYMYSFIFHRKIAYKAQDETTSRQELDAFFNDDVPFYLELDADVGTGNKFTSEGIKNGTSGGTSELIEYYNFFVETYYHLLGRRFNTDEKKERNISSEVKASQSNFDILQNEDRICKEDFLNALTKLTGVEWEEIKQEVENDNTNNTGNDKQSSVSGHNGDNE